MAAPGDKRKAEDVPHDAPAAKETKTVIVAEDGEKEMDAPADSRDKLSAPVGIEPNDMTMNVIPTTGGRLLMALSDHGVAHLIAAARANVGVSAGRYMFEVKMVEMLTPTETSSSKGAKRDRDRELQPKQMVRVGISSGDSSIFLGESEECFAFDAEGFGILGGKKKQVGRKFARDHIVALVVNLEAGSANYNTVSLFVDGKRSSSPQPLPEALKGKTLFPHVSYRNVSLQVNWGPEPMQPLPFACRMIGSAAKADVVVKQSPRPVDGKYDVVFPISLPDEGTFDWVEQFVEKHPDYTELSDRKIVEWATKSGLYKPRQASARNSNDKPDSNFGIPGLDDLSARRVVQAIAPLVPRNYIVMEVRGNLLRGERERVMSKFNSSQFRKVAKVAVGTPTPEYQARTHQDLMKSKQVKVDVEWRAKKADLDRKKAMAKRQREIAEQQRAERKKRKEEERKKREEKAKAEDGKDEAKEEVKEEAKDGVKEESDEEMAGLLADEDFEDMGEEPPPAELTAKEKEQVHRVHPFPDLNSVTLVSSFPIFSLPCDEEGFNRVDYEWLKEDQAKEYVSKWKKQKKMTTKVEDINPSEFFVRKHLDWQRTLSEWQAKQKAWKQVIAAKQSEDKEGADKAEGEQAPKEGEGGEEEAKAEDAKPEVKQESPADEEKKPVDVYSVVDVCDIDGEGEPLFANFAFEDWALMTLRFELDLLCRSFRKDVNDPERPGIPEAHLTFYYGRYYKTKQLNTKYFGQDTNPALIQMIQDTIEMDDLSILVPKMTGEDVAFDMFVKLTEDARRERQRKIDSGDDTARLRFAVASSGTDKGGQKGGKNQKGGRGNQWNSGNQWGFKGGGGGGGGGGKKGGKGGWSSGFGRW
eukprot:TRINITY_DN6990_c0_g1_i4.p1 TRINITY_DN6990_c0_g1~~TRINITY_DN6990_c0_g1_i4.p1  ORF type:complete len:868 (+),score=275.04 TRINITY_DN6990_c0_g1_i4:102-2705(+)